MDAFELSMVRPVARPGPQYQSALLSPISPEPGPTVSTAPPSGSSSDTGRSCCG